MKLFEDERRKIWREREKVEVEKEKRKERIEGRYVL